MAIKALRVLFEDFEAQIKCQSEIDEETSCDSQEEPLEETQLILCLTLQVSSRLKNMKTR